MPPTFGRYELLKRLAGGGMGEVYLARQRGIEGFSKLLVIKTLLSHLCEDDEFIAMFKDEARLTAQLIHPNICQVYEFDRADGVFYIAMEYLRGEDLRRVYRAASQQGRPLPVPLICRIAADAAAGLDFAHQLRDAEGKPAHVVHRDVSPQNIFVTFDGGVKLIDFGIAKAAGRAQHTRTGALKGKYSYMSPEQASGEEIDGRSDLFALGVVLHEMLSGRRLFKADSDEQTLERVRRAEVMPPSLINPEVPPDLDTIVLRALARRREERYQTCQELQLALEDWLVQGRMSASTAHLAQFLKVIYRERLEQEAQLGPLLGDPGLAQGLPASFPRQTSSSQSNSEPSAPAPLPGMSMGELAASGPPPGPGPLQPAPGLGTPLTTPSGGITLSRPTAGSPAPLAAGSADLLTRLRPFRWLLTIAVAGAVLLPALVLVRGRPAPLQAPAQPEAFAARLTLESDPPGAALLVGGRPAGRTPLEGLPLPAGPVRVELSLEGYVPLLTTLQLPAGPSTQRLRLERLPVERLTLLVESEPSGAHVSEGETQLGRTPLRWSTVRGDHHLTFSLPGHRELLWPVNADKDGEVVLVHLHRQGAERPREPRPEAPAVPSPGLPDDIKVER